METAFEFSLTTAYIYKEGTPARSYLSNETINRATSKHSPCSCLFSFARASFLTANVKGSFAISYAKPLFLARSCGFHHGRGDPTIEMRRP